MGVADERARSLWKYRGTRFSAYVSFLFLFFFLTFGSSKVGFVFPQPALSSQAYAEQSHQGQGVEPHEQTPVQELEHPPAGPSHEPKEQIQPKEQTHGQGIPAPSVPGHAEEHGEAHGEEHARLPEISPIPGVTFINTIVNLLDHELHGRFLGWRPNGIFLARLTNNVNYYQLGVLEAIRFTTLRLKDSLTRLGEADRYDPDLEQALNDLYIDPTSWWFPAADHSYEHALDHLRKFKTKLENGQRNFYYRRDTLVSLLSTYKDQMGNVNRTLIMPVGWWKSNDYFYYAKGVAHVYFEVLKVCRVGFKNQLATMHGADIMDEVLHELSTADKIYPWFILDSDLDGFFANHRANLNAPLSEVAHLLVVLSLL